MALPTLLFVVFVNALNDGPALVLVLELLMGSGGGSGGAPDEVEKPLRAECCAVLGVLLSVAPAAPPGSGGGGGGGGGGGPVLLVGFIGGGICCCKGLLLGSVRVVVVPIIDAVGLFVAAPKLRPPEAFGVMGGGPP